MFIKERSDEIIKQLSQQTDEYFCSLLSNPQFLKGLATCVNLQTLRKRVFNQGLLSLWKLMQLPNKKDQERSLHLINELLTKVAHLEEKLNKVQIENQALAGRVSPLKKKSQINVRNLAPSSSHKKRVTVPLKKGSGRRAERSQIQRTISQ